MRAAGFVSIAFGLALAAGAPAQAGESPAAGTKAPAAVKGALAAKAKPATRAKATTKSKAQSKSITRRAATAETSAAASHHPGDAALSATAATPLSGSLLGPSVGQVVALAPLPAGGVISPINPYGFLFRPGVYHCELDRRVDVRQVAEDLMSAVVQWDKQTYTLHAVGARTGALRYEDAASGLLWLVIGGKSMLLDTKTGKQLANECKV